MAVGHPAGGSPHSKCRKRLAGHDRLFRGRNMTSWQDGEKFASKFALFRAMNLYVKEGKSFQRGFQGSI